MKKVISLLISAIMVFSLVVNALAISYGQEHEGDYGTYGEVYTDVPTSHWAYEETKRCNEKGWFAGYPDGRFKPDASITRAEAIKVIVSFLGRELKDVVYSNYHDVDVTEWYAPYIHAGEDLFPMKWKTNNAFQPNMPMTREDTVYALVTALGYGDDIKFADESILNMFSDHNSISSIMRPYFAVALSMKPTTLVSGYDDGTIRAQDALTRAQFAALLWRASFIGVNTPKDAVLQKVAISPSSKQVLTVGDSLTFAAKAEYSDGSKKEYSGFTLVDSSYGNSVRISGNTVTAVKEGVCVVEFDDKYIDRFTTKSVTIEVENPTDAPVLKIYDYEERTTEETMRINGKVTDRTGTEIDLTCNGRDIMVSGESFSYTANLNIGRNEFVFVATNEYGNKTEKTIVIMREEEKPTTVEMINVVGKTEAEAIIEIDALGLRAEIEYVWDDNIEAGIVLAQNIPEGKDAELGKPIYLKISGGKNEWVGWTDSLPSYVSSTEYIIEEKTQYRYKTLEHKDSTSSSLNGWELKNQSESWGSWSSWTRDNIGASSTREVETKSVADPAQYKTQWHYTRYYGWDPNKKANVSWPHQGTYSKTYQESGWLDSPYENRGRADAIDATCYKNSSDNISVWWWNETTRRVELPRTYHTEYRYRDKTITYHYSRWSDWSSWSDNAISGSGEKEVETKTVYRYKFK